MGRSGVDSQQQDLHQAFAAETQPPDRIIRTSTVISFDECSLLVTQQLQCVILQIALKAATREQATAFATFRKKHERPGFAIGRPLSRNHKGCNQRSPAESFTIKKFGKHVQ